MARPRRNEPWLERRDNGVFYAFWYDPLFRETKRKSLGVSDLDAARVAFDAFLATGRAQTTAASGDSLVWRKWALRMCKRARENAKAKQRPYALTPELVEKVLAEQGYRCAVSGIPFDHRLSYRNPFAPSLDQVRPGKGYLPENVRIVLMIVNTAMNGWGEGPLLRLIFESRFTSHGSPSREVALRDDGRENAR